MDTNNTNTVLACSVCDAENPGAGSLKCEHKFCETCFQKYISGSLSELHLQLRCCICGQRTELTVETQSEIILARYGRRQDCQLLDPRGVTVTRRGDLLVSDGASGRLYVFNRSGILVNDFALTYKAVVQSGLVVTSDGSIAVPIIKDGHSCIAFYNPKGHFKTCVYLDTLAEIGGLAVTDYDDVYVADSTHSCVHVISKKAGKVVNKIPVPHLIEEQNIPHPSGITLANNGTIYVSDSANNCVKLLSNKGDYLYKFGTKGHRPAQFNSPGGLAMSALGDLIVVDRNNHRVQLFSEHGKFLSFSVRYNKGKDVYMTPLDVAYAGGNRVAVMLAGSLRAQCGEVRVYSLLTD